MLTISCPACNSPGPRHAAGSACETCDNGVLVGSVRPAAVAPRPVRRCCRCGTTWARDFHACLNIARLAQEHLAGLSHPDYLTVASAA